MEKFKAWPRIVCLVSVGGMLIGLFLPWLAASGFGREETINGFDKYFNPSQWILLGIIILTSLVSILGLATSKAPLMKLAGVLGVLAGLVAIVDMVLILCGQSVLGSASSSWGIDQKFSVGYYLTFVSVAILFIFSIVSLKAKIVLSSKHSKEEDE